MFKNVRSFFVLPIVAVAFIWVASPSSALLVVDPLPAASQPAELSECFADGWTEELLQEAALELAGVKPCRPCQGREWCTCTYSGSGGGTRISCDPCCYRRYGGEIVCLD